MRCLMKTILAMIVAVGATMLTRPLLAEEMTKDRLVGAWQLVTFTATSGDKVSYPMGEQPGGLVGFSPTRYWVMLVDTKRQMPAAATLTDPEAVALMKSHVAYTGRYDVDPSPTPDGIRVTIHTDAASNQALAGKDRVFFMRVDGNKLTLKSPALVIASTGLTSVARLEFVRVD